MTPHEAFICNAVTEMQMQRRGFWPAIENIAQREGWAEGYRLPFNPDAFSIDEEARTVTLVEVECRNPISPKKMGDLIGFWFHLDCEGWSAELVRVNRDGEWRDHSLADQYYARVTREAA